MLMFHTDNMSSKQVIAKLRIAFYGRKTAMCRISVFCFILTITSLVALPLSAQLPPSASSLSSHSSRECTFGIAGVDLIISELADESRTGAASLKIEIARNMMDEGDYKGCAKYIDKAMRALN
jgi:hypothetical protein